MANGEFLGNDAFLDEGLLKIALDSSGLAVWKVDPRTRSVAWTGPLRQMLGVPADQKIDYVVFADRIHPEDRNLAQAGMGKALDPDGDGRCDVEYRIVTPAGETKWVAANGQAFFSGESEERKPNLFVGTLRDITERRLVEANLQAAIEQQQMLVHEVNHRVKNSLQLVSSLLRLQARQIPDPATRAQIEDATTRISAIAHIHQRLYRDQDIKRINFGAFLSELCADLQGASPNCALTVEAPHFPLSTDRAIPLALIVNELVTNAFKYAYQGGAGGRVLVKVDRDNPGEIAIQVIDEGAGLPDGFSIDSAHSLGMILIGSLLNQLSGRIDVLKRDKGAGFRVTVPGDDAG